MAQTGSAQREPSMEEILASIRRIIEDSDAVRSPADEGIPEDVEVASPSSAAPAPAIEDTEVVAFRSSLDENGSRDEPSFLAEPETPAEEETGSAAAAFEPMAEIHPLRGETRPLEPTAYPSPLDNIVPPSQARDEDEPARAAPAPFSQAAAEAGDDKQSLISEQTGRQVAAAFGELSEAFAASRRRSFDEMAEEMLRPMLQDWLDNNLPTLVERLVREEIERVARGG